MNQIFAKVSFVSGARPTKQGHFPDRKNALPMRETSLLILLLSVILGSSACKSQEPTAEDPQKKIEQAFDEHMDENKELYDKDPDAPRED
jgi:hypothetical protein